MSDILIGLAIGSGSGLTIVVLGFLLLRRSMGQTESATAWGHTREKEQRELLDIVAADRDAAREAEKILHDNQRELLTELADEKASTQALAAKVATAEKAAHDLESVLKDHPGALADAVTIAAQRLREQIAALRKTDPPAAAADPPGGEARPVHGPGSDLEHP